MLPRKNRLKSGFSSILNSSNKFKTKYFLSFYIKNELDYNRFGLIVSKKHGNAVTRNKIKRIFRNILLNHLKSNIGLDVVIIPFYLNEDWNNFKDIDNEVTNFINNIC